MEASVEKAAPISASAVDEAVSAFERTQNGIARFFVGSNWHDAMKAAATAAIMQDRADRETRPSLPDSREESASDEVRILLGAVEAIAVDPVSLVSMSDAAIRGWANAAASIATEALDDLSAITPSNRASPEERIREDERDRIYERAERHAAGKMPDANAVAAWLTREEDVMLPADRARARQGGNNG